MTTFRNDEAGFQAWLRANPRGIVLKPVTARRFMAHATDCSHIAWFGPRDVPAGEWRYTTSRKHCFEEREPALAWLEEQATSWRDCRDCSPGLSSRPSTTAVEIRLEEAVPPGVVQLGSLVEVTDAEGDRFVYRIGNGPLPPDGDRVLSLGSPVAAALMSARAGETVDVSTPAGEKYALRVLSVEDP